MTARVEITADTISPALKSAVDALGGDGRRLMLEDIGEYLVRSTRDRAARQESPDGVPWQTLSPRYKREKARKRPGVPMLKYDFHMLGDRFSHQVAGDELLVGTSAPQGAIQHFGGTIKRDARQAEVNFRRERDGSIGNLFVRRSRANFSQRVTIPAYKITMPARPWLGISIDDEREVIEIMSDHLMGSVSG